MFIKVKIPPQNELPLEEQISEALLNTDNINYVVSLPTGGLALVFNSLTSISGEPSNILVADISLYDWITILKEKGLM